MQSPREILVAARELLSDPKKWTVGTMARDAEMNPVEEVDPKATCWCLFGAIIHIAGPGNAALEARDLLTNVAGKSIARFNDTHTHAEVLALLDKVIGQ